SITQGLLVAECLSFRRTATLLGVRQSAVSRRSLEDALGVSLFERYHDGVRITVAGGLISGRDKGVARPIEEAYAKGLARSAQSGLFFDSRFCTCRETGSGLHGSPSSDGNVSTT